MPFNLGLMYFLPPPFFIPFIAVLWDCNLLSKKPWFYLFIGSLVSRIMDDKYMIISSQVLIKSIITQIKKISARQISPRMQFLFTNFLRQYLISMIYIDIIVSY